MIKIFEAPVSYVIQVCVVCGAQAVYPFRCGHQSLSEKWTAPIVVKPSRATRRAVEESMRLNAIERLDQPEVTAEDIERGQQLAKEHGW